VKIGVEEHRLHRGGSLVDSQQDAHRSGSIILQNRRLREGG
jgi:hypothetical protein